MIDEISNYNQIQILRKNGPPTDTQLVDLLPGQPLYDMTNNKLYIGNGKKECLINPDFPNNFVNKSGDTMDGSLIIDTVTDPLKIISGNRSLTYNLADNKVKLETNSLLGFDFNRRINVAGCINSTGNISINGNIVIDKSQKVYDSGQRVYSPNNPPPSETPKESKLILNNVSKSESDPNTINFNFLIENPSLIEAGDIIGMYEMTLKTRSHLDTNLQKLYRKSYRLKLKNSYSLTDQGDNLVSAITWPVKVADLKKKRYTQTDNSDTSSFKSGMVTRYFRIVRKILDGEGNIYYEILSNTCRIQWVYDNGPNKILLK